MARDVNKCIFTGRLFADPETKETKTDTKIVEFSLAVNKYSKKDEETKPNSLRFVTFNKTAEFAEKYLKKGAKVLVKSHVDTGEYTKETGEKVYTTKFVVDSLNFAESVKKDNASDAPAADTADDGFINVPDGIEEELPFA